MLLDRYFLSMYMLFTSTEITLHTDVRDKDNLTPLHYACKYHGNKELVQFLVKELKCDVGEFVGNCAYYICPYTVQV